MIKEPIYCGKCSADVEEDATSCPYCGAKFRKLEYVAVDDYNNEKAKTTALAQAAKLGILNKDEMRQQLWDAMGAAIKKAPIYLTVPCKKVWQDYYGKIIMVRNEFDEIDIVKDLLERQYSLLDTSGYYAPHYMQHAKNITTISRVDNWSMDERVDVLVNWIARAGDDVVIAKWNDIMQMLSPTIAYGVLEDDNEPKRYEAYAWRNKQLELVARMLRTKRNAVVVCAAEKKYLFESGKIEYRIPTQVTHKMQYMFELDKTRLDR